MTTERRPRPPSRPPTPALAGEMKRIPLPPLPHFRKAEEARPAASAAPATPVVSPGAPRPAGPVSHVEMSELLAPDHEGGILPAIEAATPQRTGATGATILNNLVDEIEKGLEKDLARAPVDAGSRRYRRLVACASGPAPGRPDGPGLRPPAARPADVPERRTGE